MSDEFRRSILNRLPPMAPTRAPWAEKTDDDEEEELDGVGELASAPKKMLEPLSASQFFTQALEVSPPSRDTVYRAYLSPPTAPPAANQRNKQGSYLICHHGAGASGLSFAALAKEVTARSGGELGVFSYDARGHGKSRTEGDERDLSLSTLVDDFIAVIEQMWSDPKTAPALVLLGHSMGAAPIVHAAPMLQDKGYTVAGVGVLDVVEGTALESLPLMKSILGKRPTSFESVPEAIGWHVSSGTIRNETSARVSVPSYILPSGSGDKQVWRTDLLATEPFWEQWYTGLSQKFLAVRCARFLCLAGQDRLDRDLMVGQMQGKFQQEVMQDVGHYLHEDDPATLATTLVTFWRRNTQVMVLPPKIGGGRQEVKHVGQQ
ncbi:hypothetical protein CC85DRAFT_268296 [Cutaneotrichosporon oleaginosum]|uniref:Protein phosphatase methylesterase 1 n=1 Tax=Cutaneotrichosporon oleaginosum TaxID=879819 RepID=A0A0J0XZ52_9TREE|nr:uncharacterized protein CC85DRAFT_268296 [Cutaneotrichosporon oleaginosum]KLT46316.1 hypothetical protein CC85DRAFT_268296 [Cutaneotrichosporon oleaginosum]TXT10317.1 hypothetical protein COLE_04251 [Cutaneotrichosporon oleaginosum]